MGLPVPLAHMVNTLRTDVDACHDDIRHQLLEAARLRVADERTVHDILDRMKSTISQRFMMWFREGQFKDALEAIGDAPKVAAKPSVAFPTGPSGT